MWNTLVAENAYKLCVDISIEEAKTVCYQGVTSMEDAMRYKAFIRSVELGSISKAAVDLGYSQSAISRMISSLEAEWELPFLERSRAGLCLTSEGESLLGYARDLVSAHERFGVAVGAVKNLEIGTVRIATFSSVATHVLPKAIEQFLLRYPDVSYEILLGDYDEIEEWTEEGRADFGIGRIPTSPHLSATPFIKDELKVLLPKGHSLAKHSLIDPEWLCTERFFLLEKQGNTVVDEVFAQCSTMPVPVFKTWDDYSIMAMVEAGLGVSILPDLILQRIPYKVEVRPLKTPVYRQVGIVTKKVGTLSPIAEKLYEEVLQIGKKRKEKENLGKNRKTKEKRKTYY